MIDFPNYPPRGYKPFEVEVKGHRGWICATPHCDDAEALCADVWLDHREDLDEIPFGKTTELLTHYELVSYSRVRIPTLFKSEEEAQKMCWEHARQWWKGEPPEADAIPYWNHGLPPGYRVFMEVDDYRMWLVKPDGSRGGPLQILRGLEREDGPYHEIRLSTAEREFQTAAWEETHEHHAEKQDDDERQRVRAWAESDEAPRNWSVVRNDDGDYHPDLPEGHYVEMRIYMPHQMVGDIEAILRYCKRPLMGIQGHFRNWLDTAIRAHATEAVASMEKLLKKEDG